MADTGFAYGRHVPERKDDFAWENDRIGYRLYGPALEVAGEISSGIDVWVKSVRLPLLDKWYREGKYHKDRGEGGDFYKVGRTTGCGGLAIWQDGALHFSNNWIAHRVLQNGPDRVAFELDYAPWRAGGRTVRETRRITLEAGSNFNRIESRFEVDPPGPLAVALGITDRDGAGVVSVDFRSGFLSYWEPEAPPNGHIACALVADPAQIADVRREQGHHLLIIAVSPGNPLVYFAGAGWSKGGFPTRESWETYVAGFAAGRR